MPRTSDKRIVEVENVSTPEQIIGKFPAGEQIENLVLATRRQISDIVYGRDARLLAIVGPCSIHDIRAAYAYGTKLQRLREQLRDRLEIVMRVYFEKPRTTVGWKGLINDPDLDESFRLDKGLNLARQLLVDINAMGLPAATEFLDIVTGQYYADLISWGAIGARTTESQVHREMASGLSCPVGFKNGTDGNIKIAIDAIKSSSDSHIFLSPTHQGRMAIYKTSGNEDAHLILRGGKQPNYDSASVVECCHKLSAENITKGLVIDCSHANSRKNFAEQEAVGRAVAEQIRRGQKKIIGVMVESHLVEGRQSVINGKALTYGQSITDACLGWEQTESLLNHLAESVDTRFT